MTKIRYLSLLILLWTGSMAAWGQNTPDFDPSDPKEPTRPVTPEPEPEDTTTYYTLTLLATEGGSVKSGAGQYAAGQAVTVTANAASTNFRFTGWTDQTGNTLSTALSFSYTMPASASTLTARYAFQPGEPGEPAKPDIKEPEPEPEDTTTYYTLTLLATEGGSVKSGAGQYAAGQSVTVTANAASTNFRFTGWTDQWGDTLSTALSFSYTMMGNATLTARYEYVPNEPGEPSKPNEPEEPEPEVRYHTLTLLCPEGGTVTAGGQITTNGQTFSLAEASTLSLSTKLSTNFTFQGWYVADSLCGTSTSLTFRMGITDLTLEPRYSYEPGIPTEPNASLTSRNELYMMSTVGLPGETINYPLYMNAIDTIHDISFQMQVPTSMRVDFENASVSQNAHGYTLSWRLMNETSTKPRRVEDDNSDIVTDTVAVTYNTYAVELTGGITPPGSTALLVLPITLEEDIEEDRYRVWLSQVTVQQNDSTFVSASSRNGAINTAYEEPTSYIYLENLISVGEAEVEVKQSAQYSRSTTSIATLNMAEVVQLLGCSDLSFVTFKGLSGEGMLTSVYTTAQGYWFGRDGFARESSDEDRAVEVDFNPDTQSISLTQRPGFYTAEETDTLQIFFTYKYKYYAYRAILHIESGPDVIGDSLVFNKDYTLTADSPLEGTVSMHIESGVVLVIDQDGIAPSGVTVRNISFDADLTQGAYAQVLSKASPARISIEGDVSERVRTEGGKWYFLSLPFDCDLSRTLNEQGSQYAIRYYDGASRAAQSTKGVAWTNFSRSTDKPSAAHGFIFQTKHDSWTRFYAVRNDSRATLFASTDSTIALPLEANLSRNKANQGWNLMGNPYQSYFSGEGIGFDGVVTIWDEGTYRAYSPSDDEWVLSPNQAVFVQCSPDGVQEMAFPCTSRQLTPEWQTGSVKQRSTLQERRLINIALSNERMSDQTRVVINEKATVDYDYRCDANKFMSLQTEAQQLYSIGTGGTHYAINERPLADGIVLLGIYTPLAGTYTLSLERCDVEPLRLEDRLTGITTMLTDEDYTFTSAPGTSDSRFRLILPTDGAQGISSITADPRQPTETHCFTLQGVRVKKPLHGIYIIDRKKVYVP